MALAHYQGYVENVSTGKALPNAVIRVYSYPGNVLQSTFADLSSTPLPTVKTDSNGAFTFYISDGAYDLEYIYNGDVLDRIVNVPIYNPANFIGGTNVDSANVGSFAAAVTTSFTAGVKIVRTLGRNANGDGGGAAYVRWAAPMPALVANQQNYSWFQSADGAQWTLAPDQVFVAPMFGAMGDSRLTLTGRYDRAAFVSMAGVDDIVAINRALAAPMVQTLIINRQHWVSEDVFKPSGKHLRGLNRRTTGFHRVHRVGNQTTAQFGMYCENDTGGQWSDLFFNAQRAGYTGNPTNLQELLNRVGGCIVRRDSHFVRVTRVDIYNSWGYAHYSAPGVEGPTGLSPRNIIREDCRTYNCEVGFEQTGLGITEQNIDCWHFADPIDGGITVYQECAFHTYAGVKHIHRLRCGSVGSVPAVLDVTTNGLDSDTIINENCSFSTSGGQIVYTIINSDPAGEVTLAQIGKRIKNYQIIGGSAIASTVGNPAGSSPLSLLANHTDVTITGTPTFNGQGVSVGVSCNLDIIGGMNLTATRNDGSAVAVIALNCEAGKITWSGKGGYIRVVQPVDPVNARILFSGNVIFNDRPVVVSPAFSDAASIGTDAPRVIQRKRGFKILGVDGSLNIIKPGASNEYWAIVVLDAIPAGWETAVDNVTNFNKVRVTTFWSEPASSTISYPVISSMKTYRKLDSGTAAVFFAISTTAPIPADARFHYDIVEEA